MLYYPALVSPVLYCPALSAPTRFVHLLSHTILSSPPFYYLILSPPLLYYRPFSSRLKKVNEYLPVLCNPRVFPHLPFSTSNVWQLLLDELRRWSLLDQQASSESASQVERAIRHQPVQQDGEEGILGIEADVVSALTLSSLHRRPPRGIGVPDGVDVDLLKQYEEWLAAVGDHAFLYRAENPP